jgi:hypothetical protein
MSRATITPAAGIMPPAATPPPAAADPCPGGAYDNSPAIHRWGDGTPETWEPRRDD